MVGFLIAISIVIILLILFLYTKIKVITNVILNHHQQTVLISVYILRVRLMRRSIDLSEGQREEKSFQEIIDYLHSTSQNIVQKMKDLNNAGTIILNRLCFHQIGWSTQVGTGEASTAGIVTGGIRATKGLIIGLLSVKSNFKCEPSISVTPIFNQKQIQSKFDCIVSIRIGQAIYALLKVIRKFPEKKEAII